MQRLKSAQFLIKIIQVVYKGTEGFLLVVFTLMLVTDVILGIVARYVHFEIVFATELGKYLFIWLCAIGISAAANDNQHVRINFIADRLPVNRKLTWIISQCLFLVFSLFFFYLGFQLTLMHIDSDKSAMGFVFPLFIFTAALPVGFGLTSIRLIHNICSSLKKSNRAPWMIGVTVIMPDVDAED